MTHQVLRESLRKYFPPVDFRWTVANAPSQTNGCLQLTAGSDCGIFVAYSLLEIVLAYQENDRQPKFPTQDIIYDFRHQMAEEILDVLDA